MEVESRAWQESPKEQKRKAGIVCPAQGIVPAEPPEQSTHCVRGSMKEDRDDAGKKRVEMGRKERGRWTDEAGSRFWSHSDHEGALPHIFLCKGAPVTVCCTCGPQ